MMYSCFHLLSLLSLEIAVTYFSNIRLCHKNVLLILKNNRLIECKQQVVLKKQLDVCKSSLGRLTLNSFMKGLKPDESGFRALLSFEKTCIKQFQQS